ncbi:DUF1127 domain-containing protein [Reinekea sp.]|jgi:uncharacterized protein YjiS (DUF1127 family)|uniref:DUF1127 domain-containing protein n=1 Tax=Reinekea sp. TaxID=1970455 RepID=UPI002A8325F0|nr:DUF1127 domain-containing protein [Reinekea sp.]
MTTFQANLTPTSGAHSIALFAVLRVWRRNQHTRAQLKNLSIEQLRDIGLTRAQAQGEAKRAFWQAGAMRAEPGEGRTHEL